MFSNNFDFVVLLVSRSRLVLLSANQYELQDFIENNDLGLVWLKLVLLISFPLISHAVIVDQSGW